MPSDAPPTLGTVRIARCDGTRIRLERAGRQGDALVGTFVGGGSERPRSVPVDSVCGLTQQHPNTLATAGVVAAIVGAVVLARALAVGIGQAAVVGQP